MANSPGKGAVDVRLRSQRSAPRVTVSVAISAEYAERLEAIATARGLRVGQLVAEVAVDWLFEQESVSEPG